MNGQWFRVKKFPGDSEWWNIEEAAGEPGGIKFKPVRVAASSLIAAFSEVFAFLVKSDKPIARVDVRIFFEPEGENDGKEKA